MEVILLDKIANLGNLGDCVKVRPGYARNYLIPSGKAQFATPENVAKFEASRAELEQAATDAATRATGRQSQLEGAEVTINAKVGSEGKLFGSVGPSDIVEAMQAQGLEIEKREVRMPTGPLRQVGEHDIELNLHTDIVAAIKVNVVGEE